jgi:hypothetical protein
MSGCEWEYHVPKHKTTRQWAGVDICTLTGRPCLIDDLLKRDSCQRRLETNSFLQEHEGATKLAT